MGNITLSAQLEYNSSFEPKYNDEEEKIEEQDPFDKVDDCFDIDYNEKN